MIETLALCAAFLIGIYVGWGAFAPRPRQHPDDAPIQGLGMFSEDIPPSAWAEWHREQRQQEEPTP